LDYSAYLRTLLSVFVDLGLGQLVQPLHRVARFEGTVRWDWLPLGWAFFAFVMVVQTWWAYFDILQSPLWPNLFAFLLPISVFASALPDVVAAFGPRRVDDLGLRRLQHLHHAVLTADRLRIST
jgi:hypothetical protein